MVARITKGWCEVATRCEVHCFDGLAPKHLFTGETVSPPPGNRVKHCGSVQMLAEGYRDVLCGVQCPQKQHSYPAKVYLADLKCVCGENILCYT